MKISLAKVLAGLNEEQARAVYEALAQWADNENSRDDVDDAETEAPNLKAVNDVVAKLETEFVKIATP
jgi:hypothetical protein